MMLLFFLTSVWMGMHAGVSVLATLAKFKAPSITKAIALDVGRVTFNWLHASELGFLIVLGIGVLLLGAKSTILMWVLIAGLGVILSVEILVLKPILDKRVKMIMAGTQPDPSHLHLIYGSLELSLLTLLALLAYTFATHAFL